ncbi:MAG: glycosyltransferase [Lachnospiraceae bacterium]|nr:glycosyltransferase [Lachnospiraceae bacterium]
MKNRKRILLYDWGSNSQSDLQDALNVIDCNIEVYVCDLKWKSYDEDPQFTERFEEILKKEKINLCFSFNFFPLIARICAEHNLLYVSWVYDCPHNTLYSDTLKLNTNLIFTIDRLQMERFREKGVSQIYHMPLAVNVGRLDAMRAQVSQEALQKNFSAEISFVGSLYEDNFYRQISYLPPHLKGYLDGICRAQMQLYGIDLLEDVADDALLSQLQKHVVLSVDPGYSMTYWESFCDNFLRKNISGLERVEAIGRLAERYQTVLYSDSYMENENVIQRGRVNYRNQMPLVFMASALNLNLSIRSIRSGIPLRCMDIMGAGGVLFSNMQPELMEYFEEGIEWIGFGSMDELMDKAEFYLEREDLRQQIAYAGYQKVKAEYTYQHALQKIFHKVEQFV